MSEMHLRLDLHIALVEHLQKQRKNAKIKKKQQYIYQNQLDKPCFPHDMAYIDFKDFKELILFLIEYIFLLFMI